MQTLATVSDVVDALGGGSAVSRLIEGCSPQRVWNWQSLGYFPPHTYVALQTALKKIECDAPDTLWRMEKSNPDALDRLRAAE